MGKIDGHPGLDRLPSGKVRARYRDAQRRQYSKTFPKRGGIRAAEAWLEEQHTAVRGGSHVDPNDKTTVAAYARRWVDARPFRASTAKRYDGMISAHIEGTDFGKMRLSAVLPTHVQEWVKSRSLVLAPSTLARLFTFAQSLFKAAMAERLIVWTPCTNITLSEAAPVEHQLVSAAQVEAVAAQVPARYEVLVRLLATCGLRIGEALALRAEDVDRERQVLRVARTLDQHARAVGPVKTPRTPRRDVPVPRSLLSALAQHQLAYPPSDNEVQALSGLLFTSAHGRPLRYDVFAYKVFHPAAQRAGIPDLTPHGLRHYAGSTLLHEGVPPVTVAKILGHSVQTLLSTYAHALPSGDDLARQAMERTRGVTAVSRSSASEG